MERYLKSGERLELKGISGHYIIKDIIGRGSSCVVFYNENNEKTEHLLKEFNPKCIDLARYNGELKPVRNKDAEHFNSLCTRFKAGFDLQGKLRFVPELKNYTANIQNTYYDHGTMYIDLTETEGRSYAHVEETSLYNLAQRIRVLAQVIGNYHKQGYLHLDIKPSNIFVRPEDETCQDILLFDFDSLVPFHEENGKCILEKGTSISYTTEYAPIELISESRRNKIGKVTDIYAIGEIFFEKLMGRHSTALEHNAWADYEYNFNAPILKNVNPKVYPLLDELFHHTLSNNTAERYQSAEELISCLDEIIEFSNPKEPFLKSSLPNISGFFTGRDAEIAEIHNRLQENNVLFLSGIGGIGKSELAKHYADKYKNEYDSIIFAPFVNNVQMMIADDDYVPIYNFSQYPEEKPDEYFTRKMRKLGELCDKHTLIIIDNLDTTEDENFDKLFQLECRILVTTRMDFSDVYPDSKINLEVLSNPFAVFNEYYKKPLSDEERKCIDEIIEIVCGHTMTVELLAKQMMAGRVKPENMLEKLKAGGICDSGKEKIIHANEKGEITRENTYAHIQALFDLSELDKDEKYVLANLSLIPHTGIYTELFCKWCEIENYDIINMLVLEGWIRWNKGNDSISIHPLISELVLVNLDDATILEKIVKTYIIHLRERDSTDVENNQNHCEDNKINVHFLNLIEKYNLDDSFFGVLLSEIGGQLFTIHQYDLALRACEISTRITLKNDDAQGFNVTESIAQTALIKASIGAEREDYAAIREAIRIYLQAIEKHKTFDENEHPDNYDEIATLYNYSGLAYCDLDEVDCAREMFNNGIAIYTERTAITADDYQSLGILYNNLGNTYSGSEALKYYLVAKENHDKSGILTRHAAITLHHLADLYSCEDNGVVNLELAAEYAKCALEYFEAEYTDDLYMIGEAKYMLGKIYSLFKEANFTKTAYTLLTEAEEIFLQFLPPEDDTIIKIRGLKKRGFKNQ